MLDEYLRLAKAAGCEKLDRRMELAAQPQDQVALDSFWQVVRQERGVPERVVCLNPGGAFGAAKHWPSEHFGTLARRIATEYGRAVLVLCGPAERDVARDIVRFSNHPSVYSLADAPVSIGLTKAAVRSAELLVTTDSGPRHFAAPFGVPAITLFGPTHPLWSETYYELGVSLQHPVDCGPCQQRVCPQGHHRCLRDLSPDRVFGEVAAILSSGSMRRAA
ncbi:MAG: glycosyltransferase family 9 protein [Planctomycetota bacterium]|nr:glycosyltransferase family 9 protein [Planctomycetota bacterium]